MDKAEALQSFYKKNKIDADRVSDEDDCSYDERIAQLPEQIDHWLSHFDPSDHELFLSLLCSFTYLNQAQCRKRYKEIVSMLECQLNSAGIGLSEVLFVTIESGRPYKSGADNVRSDLHSRHLKRIPKEHIITAQSRLDDNRQLSCKAVVFIDDIVGSGCTLWHEIRTFTQRFSIDGHGDVKLYYACIVPRKDGMKYVERQCRKNNILISPLVKDDWYAKAAFTSGSDEYKTLFRYETATGTDDPASAKTFFMGFSQNKLLIAFYYNTPNNTLCTFWRYKEKINDPPFYRDGNQPAARPSISDLKETKRNSCQDAYEFGKSRAKNKWQ